MLASLSRAFVLTATVSFGLIACSAPAEETEEEASSQGVEQAPTPASSAALGFVCECKAIGPGFEKTVNDKFCQYDCRCQEVRPDGMKRVDEFRTPILDTSARSLEKWDFGSHICHGQYTWRPAPTSPNWQIEVKFSSFQISHAGNVSYASEMAETSTTVREPLRRTEQAPEIRDAIASKLKIVLPKSSSAKR